MPNSGKNLSAINRTRSPPPDRIPFELEPPPPDIIDSFLLRERRPPRDRPPQPDRPNSFLPRERRPPRDRPDFPQVFKALVATRRTSKAVWRVGAIHSPQTQAAIAVNLQAIDLEMASIGNIFLIAIPVVLLLVAGGAWVISRGCISIWQGLSHSGRQFINENQRFTAGMLRPYEYICKNEMHPIAEYSASHWATHYSNPQCHRTRARSSRTSRFNRYRVFRVNFCVQSDARTSGTEFSASFSIEWGCSP